MKLSFSLSSSKPSSSRPLPVAALSDGGDAEKEPATASAKSEFVTVFDPTVTLGADAAASIAPLPDTGTWKALNRMKNLLPPPSDPDSSSTSAVATRFELDASQPAPGGGSYGLTLRSKGGGGGGGGPEGDVAKSPDRGAPGDRSEPLVSATQKCREDVQRLPDDRGFHEFQDIALEDFSRAVLAGYGWKTGRAVGRRAKEDPKVREYEKRAGTGGLGFNPELPVDKKRKKGREGLPPLPPPARSARTSANGSSTAKGNKSKIVRVIAGEHAGLKAEVLQPSSHSGSAHGMVVLSLLRSGLELRVREDMIAELGSAEEESCLRKLKEIEVREGGEMKDEKKRDDMKDSRRKHKTSSRSEDGSSSSRNRKHESSKRHKSSSDRDGEPVSWLRSHIRVRIISKDFRGGKLYLKKAEVMDVVGPRTCDVSMDESGERLQGVDQEILETALPKRGGPVLVLFGRHKGRFGNLMEKDSDKETAVVQDADNHELIKVRLEQIAEYVGDPSVLGY